MLAVPKITDHHTFTRFSWFGIRFTGFVQRFLTETAYAGVLFRMRLGVFLFLNACCVTFFFLLMGKPAPVGTQALSF